ncbi:hypothetical protein J7F03_18665 [Streptomyces sp. ISL-43]|uniref:DUF6215 domain-containing protein n=1 Tax=Streptomyces sp. ISL-43 TaxID=2819183 RepID=UPI001BE7ABC4|nr:DUF6215 domain-containing protein [Streptomyces sp. ISL-43]MBT2449082.1 hypothetical protein [Streptomyces sp. ISL-43]
MADDFDARNKGVAAVGQAITAVALVGALGIGFWTLAQSSSATSTPPRPATCSGGEPDKTQAQSGDAPPRASGAQLCTALHRPDLAELLGTPGEIAKSAGGSAGSVKVAGGKEITSSSARVELGTYTVTLRADYDLLPVATTAALLGDGAPGRTVLGRPAVLYSDRTISIGFRLDGSDSHSRPGVPARVLVVAQDAQDSGGSLSMALWRTDGLVPDDAALLRVAETVLPTLPGWSAAG